MAAITIGRREVLRFRMQRHQLDAEPGASAARGVALLDCGVQDTGHDGAAWALALRGAAEPACDELALVWTLRGAPHVYRRSELADVAVATAPLSEVDARKRIFDAAKPLKAAGVAALDALRVVADQLRSLVRAPTAKGDASAALTQLLDEPFLRFCRPCGTTHVYEMPFRLAALQAGLELEPGTSPPVLRRIPGLRPNRYRRLAVAADPRFDVVRGYLRFYAPATARDVATFVDAPLAEVRARWPDDVVHVSVDGDASPGRSPRFVLASDLDALSAAEPGRAIRLVGPYDPYLQLRDRELLVTDEARRKDLWRVLGRPGAIVADGEIVGTWRPRAAGRRLTVRVEPWEQLSTGARRAVEDQAERLAAHRDVVLAAVAWP